MKASRASSSTANLSHAPRVSSTDINRWLRLAAACSHRSQAIDQSDILIPYSILMLDECWSLGQCSAQHTYFRWNKSRRRRRGHTVIHHHAFQLPSYLLSPACHDKVRSRDLSCRSPQILTYDVSCIPWSGEMASSQLLRMHMSCKILEARYLPPYIAP